MCEALLLLISDLIDNINQINTRTQLIQFTQSDISCVQKKIEKSIFLVLSDLRKGGGGVQFDRVILTETSFQRFILHIRGLCMCHTIQFSQNLIGLADKILGFHRYSTNNIYINAQICNTNVFKQSRQPGLYPNCQLFSIYC